MKLTVIGTGYVGLVTGACLAEMGNEVTCVDVDERKIEQLHKGVLPIYEPGLDTVVLGNYKEGRLKFTTSLNDPISRSQIILSRSARRPARTARPICSTCSRW